MVTMPKSYAVILAGGEGSRLYPLNSTGMPKVLLPVANKPLLTFPLRMLEEGGITNVLVVCEGDGAAVAVKSWVAQYIGVMHIEVIRVAAGLPSVAALKHVIDKVKADHFVLLSGDVVTDAPLRAQILMHHLKGAAVTALFGRRKSSPAADTQPGKAPRGVDYVGLAMGDRLVFFNHSPEKQKELRIPASIMRQHSNLDISTMYADMQVYVFNTAILRAVLDTRSDLLKLEDHLLPYLVRHQRVPPADVLANLKNNSASGDFAGLAARMSSMSLTGLSDAEGTITSWPSAVASGAKEWYCAAYLVPEGAYCQRANTLQGYADVNREVITHENAPKLLREQPNARYDNFVAGSVVTGTKTNVGSGCMVGENSALGDKTSVKRSVIGRDCQIGNNVKVINSVIMDGVTVGDNCHIQNSIICADGQVKENVELKDCQVGPGFVVATGNDHKGEISSKEKAQYEEILWLHAGDSPKFDVVFSSELRQEITRRKTTSKQFTCIDSNLIFRISLWKPAPWYVDLLDGSTNSLDGFGVALQGRGVHVYIFGQGTIATDHPEFGRRAFNDFIAPGSEGCSEAMTGIASVLGGSTYGLSRNVTIHAVSIIPCSGIAYSGYIQQAFTWVMNNAERPAVILTTFSSKNQPFLLETAIYQTIQAGIPIIASSGFLGQRECLWWPGKSSDITVVGAVDRSLRSMPLSNEGACVTLFAPGSDIFAATSVDNSSTIVIDGTALSAALTTAVASQFLNRHKNAPPYELNRFLKQSAIEGALQLDDQLSPNTFLHINRTMLSKYYKRPSPQPPSTESLGTYKNSALAPASTEDYEIDEPQDNNDDDYDAAPEETLPRCEGFTGTYYLLDEPLQSFNQLSQYTPKVTRTDKWLWFPSGSECAWDLPWPSFTTSELIAVFSGYWNVKTSSLYRFQVNTPALSNVRLFVDGDPVIALPAAHDTCPNATETNQGDAELAAGNHYIELYFERSASDPTAGLGVFVAQIPRSLNGKFIPIDDYLVFSPLGGSSVVSTNPKNDNGISCGLDYTGYRACRCYACKYSTRRQPCEEFCPPIGYEVDVPRCPQYYLNLPESVLKYANNWKILSQPEAPQSLQGGWSRSMMGDVGEAKWPVTLDTPANFTSKVQNYDPFAANYNLTWWLQWHQCQPPMNSFNLTDFDLENPPAANWLAVPPCQLRSSTSTQQSSSAAPSPAATLGRRLKSTV